MYFVGRIEDGIKRGKIVDIGASTMEKKRISPDKRVQTVFGERRNKKRSHTTQEKPIKNHPRSSLYAQVPMAGLHSPQRFTWALDQEFDSSYQSVPFTPNDLRRVTPRTDLKLRDSCHSRKA